MSDMNKRQSNLSLGSYATLASTAYDELRVLVNALRSGIAGEDEAKTILEGIKAEIELLGPDYNDAKWN